MPRRESGKIKLKENIRVISSKLEGIGISKLVQVIFVLAAICTITGFILSLMPESDSSVEYIMIDAQPHHLGNVNNSVLFPEAPNYEGQYYEKDFTLDHLTEELYIIMETRDVDPKIENGPARLRINNKCDYYLNEHVKEERYTVDNLPQNYAKIKIPVDSNDFKVGINKISISVGIGEHILYYKGELYQIEDLDDIEFWNLSLKMVHKR